MFMYKSILFIFCMHSTSRLERSKLTMIFYSLTNRIKLHATNIPLCDSVYIYIDFQLYSRFVVFAVYIQINRAIVARIPKLSMFLFI